MKITFPFILLQFMTDILQFMISYFKTYFNALISFILYDQRLIVFWVGRFIFIVNLYLELGYVGHLCWFGLFVFLYRFQLNTNQKKPNQTTFNQ
jgi:hypothetical protein